MKSFSPNEKDILSNSSLLSDNSSYSEKRNEKFFSIARLERLSSSHLSSETKENNLSLSLSLNDSIFRTNKIKINEKDVIFKKEENWNNSDICEICSIKFNKIKGVYKHHCRVCGNSICDTCSTNTINDRRSCEYCFFKIKNKNLINRKNNILELKDETINKLQKNINEVLKNIEINDHNIKTLENEIKKENNNDKEIEHLKSELSRIKKYYLLKKENFNQKKLYQLDEEKIYSDKLKQINDKKHINQEYFIMVNKKKENLEIKKIEHKDLTNQLNIIKQSESFVNNFDSFSVESRSKSNNNMENEKKSITSIKNIETRKRKITFYEKRNMESLFGKSSTVSKNDIAYGIQDHRYCYGGNLKNDKFCKIF